MNFIVEVSNDFGKTWEEAGGVWAVKEWAEDEDGNLKQTGKWEEGGFDYPAGAFENENEAAISAVARKNANQRGFERRTVTRLQWRVV